MRGLKYVFVLAAALFAGGCLMEPLEPEPDEELGTVAEEVSAALPAAETEEAEVDTVETSPLDGRRPTRAGAPDPLKPQPDPWIELRRADNTNTSPTP